MDESGRLVHPPDLNALRRDFFAVSINDDETRRTLAAAYKQYGVMLEPHGAVGFAGLMRFFEAHPETARHTAISLETAHPESFRKKSGPSPEKSLLCRRVFRAWTPRWNNL